MRSLAYGDRVTRTGMGCGQVTTVRKANEAHAMRSFHTETQLSNCVCFLVNSPFGQARYSPPSRAATLLMHACKHEA